MKRQRTSVLVKTRLLLPLVCIALTSMIAAGAFEDGGLEPEQIVYKTVGDVALHLHMFKPEGWQADDTRPAIVFFFGGGWRGGTPKQFYRQSAHYAKLGMVAFSAEYRVKSRHGTSPFECVEDGKSAVRYIRGNAGNLGVDPKRIVAGGGSAGGHVAACTGVIEGFEGGDKTGVSSKPNAMLLFNPVIDTTEKGYGTEKLDGRERELSPVHHVKAGAPPTIVFHGTEDTTVPFENAERFCEKMKAAGNRCELVAFEGAGHGFFNYGRFEDAFDVSLQKADAFLKSLGYLPVKQATTRERGSE
ncbi:MAG: alpha/beta hydrolase [Candidatus Hydrogenedentota bacterium]